MDPAPLLGFLVVAAVLYGFYWQYQRKGTYVANDQEFAQAGVRIRYTERTITINGKTYSVDLVKRVRSHGMNVWIDIDDLAGPVHTLWLFFPARPDKLMQRITTALRKVGGPSLI